MNRSTVWVMNNDGTERHTVDTRRNVNHAEILARLIARGPDKPRVGIYDNNLRRWITKNIATKYEGGIEPSTS